MEATPNLPLIFIVLAAVAAFIPLIGSGVGAFISGVINLGKLLGWVKEGWGGGLFVVGNLIAFIVLYLLLGRDPSTGPLPENIALTLANYLAIVKAVTDLLGALPPELIPVIAASPVVLLHFLGQLFGGLAFHKAIAVFIPRVSFSALARRRVADSMFMKMGAADLNLAAGLRG